MNPDPLMQFLTKLKFNNERAWFDAHRAEYQALRQAFVGFMGEVIAGVAAFDPAVAAVRPQDTLFRINRDTRFAGDKSPYKTTFSAAISPGGRHSSSPLYYLQLGPEQSLVAGGVYFPQPGDLRIIREYIGRFPRKAEALLADPSLGTFGGLAQDGLLVRFPRGYGEGSALLKYKSFTVGSEFDSAQLAGAALISYVVERYRAMEPLHAWLREALSYRAPN
ncbi:DUF2461 domain-containing protein [Deinococcus sp.]|uniref:DUF2461 domain-containing protein n=1 Tax=Deinococcus sp. TaxID=47478 RepID=UPI003CC6C73F